MISIKGFRAACCRLTDIGVLFSGVRGGGVPTGTRRSAPDAGVTVAGGGIESAGLAYCFCKTLFHCWTINLSEGLPLAYKQNKNHPQDFRALSYLSGRKNVSPCHKNIVTWSFVGCVAKTNTTISVFPQDQEDTRNY